MPNDAPSRSPWSLADRHRRLGRVLAGRLAAYYQQYSDLAMIWFDALVLLPITAIVYLVLRRIRPARRLTIALWLAFYFTVPLAVYDWLYCGLYLGHGARFLSKYWYLTVYYAIPWVLLPLVATLLNRADAARMEGRGREVAPGVRNRG